MVAMTYTKPIVVLSVAMLLCFPALGGGPLSTVEKVDSGRDDQILWWYPLDAPSFGSSAVGDIDEDGNLEIVFGTYFGDEHVYALNADDGSLLWSYDTGGCNDASPVIADVDLDGHLEVVIPASSPSLVYCFNGMTGQVEWSRSTGASNCIDSPPAIADVDADEKPEVILGTFYGNVFCLNGEDGSVCWQKNLGTDSYIQSEPAVLDVNGDEQLDVVVAQFSGDNRVYALWGNNGSVLWYSDIPQDYMYHGCSFADIDDDGRPELVIGCYDTNLYVFNGEDGSLAWEYDSSSYIGAPTSLGDLNNDGFYEIVCASGNTLRVLSHTGQLLWSVPTGGDLFRGAALSDIDGDGILDVVFGSYDGILRAVRGDDGQVLWTYDVQDHYGLTFQMDHAPVIADFNNDGRLDVFIVGGFGEYPPENNHGRAYALTAGDGSGPGWPMFRYECRRSGCFSVSSNQPPSVGNLTGPIYGRPGVNYTFCLQFSDLEGDMVYVMWDWGDGSQSGWSGPYASGEIVCATHVWANEGWYSIRVKLRDDAGAEGEWSDPLLVCIDGTAPTLTMTKPQQGSLYICDKWRIACPATIVCGKLTVLVETIDELSGLAYVHFFVDAELEENRSALPYSWKWTERSFSRHTLNVTSYDHAGNKACMTLSVWKFF